jgi:hypothetical protein
MVSIVLDMLENTQSNALPETWAKLLCMAQTVRAIQNRTSSIRAGKTEDRI